jgi:hypothetical protein
MFWRKREKETEQVIEKDFFDYTYDKARVLYKDNFEGELKNWIARTPGTGHNDFNQYEVELEVTTSEKHSGTQCMRIHGRQRGWNGAALYITNYLKENIFDYEIMVWVKLRDDAKTCRVFLSIATLEVLCGVSIPMFDHVEDYERNRGILTKFRLPVGTVDENDPKKWDIKYPDGYATDDGWVLLRGKINIRKSNFSQVYIYIETDDDGETNDIYIDDFVLLTGKQDETDKK